jgi:CheY-like chemotaxis protein
VEHQQPRKLRVLVADDNEDIRRAIINILEEEFDVVEQAESGLELVSLALALAPDVIVSDLVMPMLSGLEAMRALRAAERMPPFVLVTASTGDALEWINLGALAVVNKLDLDQELVKAVKSAAVGFTYLSTHAKRPYS